MAERLGWYTFCMDTITPPSAAPVRPAVPAQPAAPSVVPTLPQHPGRRIAVIIGLVALAGLAGWFVYDRFFAKKALTEDEQRTAIVNQVSAESLPIPDEQKESATETAVSGTRPVNDETRNAILQMVSGQAAQ